MFRLGFLLIALVLAIGPPDAFAHDFLLDRQLEVLDVADLDFGGHVALAPYVDQALVAPSGVDTDCDGDVRPPAMREPHDYKSTCNTTASWWAVLTAQHA